MLRSVSGNYALDLVANCGFSLSPSYALVSRNANVGLLVCRNANGGRFVYHNANA